MLAAVSMLAKCLTLLPSERPNLHRVLPVLGAIVLSFMLDFSYVMGKVLSGELSCMQTNLVPCLVLLCVPSINRIYSVSDADREITTQG